MLKIDKFNLKAMKTGQVILPKYMEEKENLSLVSQAVHIYQDRVHIGSSKTKTRAEINRTTKKVYKQKGTGGARHGSRRAPIYVGGGIAHGPKLEQKVLTLSTKMKRKALNVALSMKAKMGEVIAIEGLSTVKKTKDARKLTDFGRMIIALTEVNIKKTKTLKNLKDTKIISFKDLNAYDVVFGGKLVLDAAIFEVVKEKTKKPEVKVKTMAKAQGKKTK